MEKVIEQIAGWSYIDQLPADLYGFKFHKKLIHEETIYYLFSYEHTVKRRSITVLYDHATKDYKCKITVGLQEYFDPELIFTKLEQLEMALKNRLDNIVKNLGEFKAEKAGKIFLSKNILDWSYIKELPQELCGFEIFITPDKPLKIINGSFIILDYSDFISNSNFVICYNIYRDEFFAEIKIMRTPKATSMYDAKTLSALKECLENNLKNTLMLMRSEINQFNEC